MKQFQPADHLHSRTFLGLLVAQFFAAFNDQAIHAAAMFYAINTGVLSEARAIELMPLLFYLPWAIFPTLAGYFADRYSKQNALILWKVVEVGITLLALYGFWLGRNGDATAGAWTVLACVFLMGTHSAFFVPAKYGVMPEILTPRMLSRGNGILESLSFIAIIAGTVFGGVLSSDLVVGGVRLGFRGQEYMIGLTLTGLAVFGAVASFLIERMPAANPLRVFPPYVYQPLYQNVRMLLTSRPLLFCVVGLAFFTFLVAYMRQVVYMHGQSQLPRWSEAYTSYVVGVVALGIGVGSPLVGYLSGGKVEVGLVTIGAVGMIGSTAAAAFGLFQLPLLVTAIACIGFFTGFYLVPLYSLLQHRAPKQSKGDAVATSNFLNITGAIAASLIFFALNQAARQSGFTPTLKGSPPIEGVLSELDSREGHPSRVVVDGRAFVANEHGPESFTYLRASPKVGKGDRVKVWAYTTDRVTKIRVLPADAAEVPFYDQSRLPELLFLGAGGLTVVILVVLWWLLPDLFRRTWIWATTRTRVETAGLLALPGSGPVLVATNAVTAEERADVESGLDRVTYFLDPGPGALVRGAYLLGRGEVVAVSDPGLLRELTSVAPTAGQITTRPLGARISAAPTLPVRHYAFTRDGVRRAYVVAGPLLGSGAAEAAQLELERLWEELAKQAITGGPLEKEAH